MDTKSRKEILVKVAEDIRRLGYDVYITTHENYAYAYVLNGIGNIAYFEISGFGYPRFSTLHVPSREYGSGFLVSDGMPEGGLTRGFVDSMFLANTKEFPYANVVPENADNYLSKCDRLKDLVKL
jgi:hypothetical protein